MDSIRNIQDLIPRSPFVLSVYKVKMSRKSQHPKSHGPHSIWNLILLKTRVYIHYSFLIVTRLDTTLVRSSSHSKDFVLGRTEDPYTSLTILPLYDLFVPLFLTSSSFLLLVSSTHPIL